jgi:hypothetical protein
MSYTINFTDNTYQIEKEMSEEEVYSFILSKEIKAIRSIHKSYQYNDITNLCLYDHQFADTDYIGNYTTLTHLYGPNPLNNTDIQVLNYLQKK